MRSFKLCFVFIIVIILFLFCGCTQRQITYVSDELMANSWQNFDKFNKEISLTFDGNNADLKIKTDDFNGNITGIAIVNDTNIEIFDNKLKEKFCFNYVLYGDKIELTYKEKTIELNKVNG